MKLHSDVQFGMVTVTGYSTGSVSVNGRPFTSSVILTPRNVVPDWPVNSVDALTPELLADLATVDGKRCDVVLLGTGLKQRFPSPAVLRPLIEARIGVEVMDTAAACRTFNVLVAEGRTPLAALIVE